MSPEKDKFNNPIQYSDQPLLSGYISNDNLNILKNSVPFKVGDVVGKIIMFTNY